MSQVIRRMIRAALAPYISEIAALRDEVEDLHRRAANMNRIGICVAVDHASGRCQVSHGGNRTPWIKYFNPAAGAISETRHPSVGEQCLLINYGAGDGSAQSMALFGLPTTAYPVVSGVPELHRRTYKDGTAEAYDHNAHRYTRTVGTSTVTVDRAAIELTSNGTTLRLDASGFSLSGATGTLTGPTTNTGGITVAGGAGMHSTGDITTDGDVVASGVSATKHRHRENGAGSLSDPPE